LAGSPDDEIEDAGPHWAEDGAREAGEDGVAQFRAAFERHYGAVLGYASRRTPTQEDAEEVTASTFVTAWRRIDRLPPEPYTRTWLYRVVWRTLANQRRADDRHARLVERMRRLQVGSEPAGASDADEDGKLLEALGRLRQQDQEVLRLVAWEELSYGEAAVTLGCTPNAFATRLHRARAALKEELEIVNVSRAATNRAGRAVHGTASAVRRSSHAAPGRASASSGRAGASSGRAGAGPDRG